MADTRGNLVDGDALSSPDDSDNNLRLPASTSGGSSNTAIDPGGSVDQGNENRACSTEADETLCMRINLHTTGSGEQIVNELPHRPIPDSKDKGKAPVRIGEASSDGTRPDDTEVSNRSSQSQTYTTDPPSTARDQSSLELPTTSGVTFTDKEGDGKPAPEKDVQHEMRPASPETSPKPSGQGSEEENCTTSLKPSLKSKQKQKQKAKGESSHAASGAGNQSTSEETETPVFRPPQYGDPGWEKSADRPPKKLPIRFKDAVGRKFMFPWEKAKTWAGMESLIRSCFLHVDVIGPHVHEGRYDLVTNVPVAFSADVSVGFTPQPALQPVGGQPSSSIASPETETAPHPIAGPSVGEPALPQAPTPPPAAPPVPTPSTSIIILPELWEDLAEPGMFITMHMWPLNEPPPPPPVHHHLLHPGVPAHPGMMPGRGRGRGGRGGGRGMPPPPALRPPGWVVIEAPKPRGKTRKRQDGL
ncbi:hypothetical protein F5Y04DRAFT_68167 [Hypomontagnella monticulosa]|nr:hypothetical protein F5Y04DRAFT_68167 [Hypomontagnella monticulosa]